MGKFHCIRYTVFSRVYSRIYSFSCGKTLFISLKSQHAHISPNIFPLQKLLLTHWLFLRVSPLRPPTPYIPHDQLFIQADSTPSRRQFDSPRAAKSMRKGKTMRGRGREPDTRGVWLKNCWQFLLNAFGCQFFGDYDCDDDCSFNSCATPAACLLRTNTLIRSTCTYTQDTYRLRDGLRHMYAHFSFISCIFSAANTKLRPSWFVFAPKAASPIP